MYNVSRVRTPDVAQFKHQTSRPFRAQSLYRTLSELLGSLAEIGLNKAPDLCNESVYNLDIHEMCLPEQVRPKRAGSWRLQGIRELQAVSALSADIAPMAGVLP